MLALLLMHVLTCICLILQVSSDTIYATIPEAPVVMPHPSQSEEENTGSVRRYVCMYMLFFRMCSMYMYV